MLSSSLKTMFTNNVVMLTWLHPTKTRPSTCTVCQTRTQSVANVSTEVQRWRHLHRVRHKKETPRFLGYFLSNGREFQREILYTYLFIMYLHAPINSI